MKHREINLHRWKLAYKSDREAYSDLFIIDRGDNKRRRTTVLFDLLLELNNLSSDHKKELTIGGYDEFRGYAISYGCTP